MNKTREALKLTTRADRFTKNRVVLPFTALHLELAVASATGGDTERLVAKVLDFNAAYAKRTMRITRDRIEYMKDKVIAPIERKNLSL